MKLVSLSAFLHGLFKCLICFVLAFSVLTDLHAQEWYKQLKKEHTQTRIGFGANISEPLGLTFEMFKGDFCSNGNGYKATTIVMFNTGIENILGFNSLLDEEFYDDFGIVEDGGIRGEIGLMLPLFSVPLKFVTFQFHVGPGIEGGSRKYTINEEEFSTTDFGGNGHLRLTITPNGFESGNGLAFLSFNVGLKYHYVFKNEYSYLKPTAGAIIRFVR